MALNTQNETLRALGNWDLLEKIADRGMGSVYKARNRASGEMAAVKVMPPFQADKDQAYQRFARECRILSALHDAHIVGALDFGIEGSEAYLVMEFVEGESLAQRLAREGSIAEDEAVRLIKQVAGALARAHRRGLVHRNVKPESILITTDGQAKLTDLCLVKEVENQEALTRDGTSLGTPNFMAPEQFCNAGKATRRSDVYSLAATLYMAVTGELPFSGSQVVEMWARKLRNDLPTPKKLMPNLSTRTDRAIRRAMSAVPDNRSATCDEFVENLTSTSEMEILPRVEQGENDQTASEPVGSPVPAATAGNTAHGDDAEPIPRPRKSKAAPVRIVENKDGAGSGWVWMVGFTFAVVFLSGLFVLLRMAHAGG